MQIMYPSWSPAAHTHVITACAYRTRGFRRCPMRHQQVKEVFRTWAHYGQQVDAKCSGIGHAIRMAHESKVRHDTSITVRQACSIRRNVLDISISDVLPLLPLSRLLRLLRISKFDIGLAGRPACTAAMGLLRSVQSVTVSSLAPRLHFSSECTHHRAGRWRR